MYEQGEIDKRLRKERRPVVFICFFYFKRGYWDREAGVYTQKQARVNKV